VTVDAAKVRAVFDLIVEGRSEPEVAEEIERLWPDEDARPLIVAAVEYLNDPTMDDGLAVTRWGIAATQSIYRKAVEEGDLTNARLAARQVADLAQRLPRGTARGGGSLAPERRRANGKRPALPAGDDDGREGVIVVDGRRVAISDL
jgi:hypothetical protein